MRSTPVSAMARTVLRFTPPDASSKMPSAWASRILTACRNWSRLTWKVANTKSYVAAQTFLRVKSHSSSPKSTINRQQSKSLLGWTNISTAHIGTHHQRVSRDTCLLGRQNMTEQRGCRIAHAPDLHEHLLAKLSGGRIVEAAVKAITESTDGVRLQVSFGEETALIYSWQIV